MIFIEIIFLLLVLLILFWQGSLLYVAVFSAPTVYANEKAIIDAYKLANLRKGELVVDLGCGNARSLIIAAKKFEARGVGVELSPYCYLKSKINVFLAGESKNVKIIFGDFKATEKYLKNADVVYLYLLNSVLAKIEPWFFATIKSSSRTVVLSFEFKKHKEVKSVSTKNLGRKTKIRLYKPATLDKM